ncbi:alpha/beta fold hydrolase [Pediococcus claussenii]|uniref:Alpha/beta hydrolase fold family protein n=1 Tax=Pediococcus claussenii (strain ATCC BAA-344 / DSM 14800 / JCM 18046 / KCTC 3811 / LMG 21948 / P06) TaxID=701521 RepID=G8PDX1_PEDCP|nr:alpha/beta hydrolase [Pediococcus claussenii]AEV95456.1 alpha/beta hydrolase fold family protein [Pediococcus claussenii ATCC BAA-344]ANZ68982.1 alpha/beta hydrolase [Pediococcus claussenii]ANZ70798.1 alpha/beta hydrolase [Pediococcus claussenii]KRN20307.1 hypothetical protein IV79_GL000976 [Pediococcus claussenii]
MYFETEDKVRLYYEDLGKGQPIIFLTGFGGNAAIWQGQKSFFVKQGFRVVCLEYRNHGRSDHVSYGIRMNRLALDVISLIDRLDIFKPVIVGNSMGGSVVFNIAHLKGWDYFSKAIIVDQSPKMLNDEKWKFGFKNMKLSNFLTVIGEPLNHPYYQHVDDEVFRASKAVDIDFPFSRRESEDLLTDHALKDWRGVLRDANIPIAFILGKESAFYNEENAGALRWINNKIEIHSMNRVGHIPMAEDPKTFNEIMLRFLKS